jgi:hypothetical protein
VTEHTEPITPGVISPQPTRGTVGGMTKPTSPRHVHNELHDAYVQSVNAALAAGHENVALELAATYDADRTAAADADDRHLAEERRAA